MKKLRTDDDEPASLVAPTACPFCGSSHVATANEKVDAGTYWRCKTCDQMWNVGRLRMNSRHGYGGR